MPNTSPSSASAAPALAPSFTSPIPDPSAERRRCRLQVLKVLNDFKDVIEAGKQDYVVHRELILKIHARLNEDGVIAPAFRPLIERQKFPYSGTGPDVGTLIFLDQMRIDLHWLMVNGCMTRSYSGQQALAAIARDGILADGVKAYLNLRHKMKARAADFDLNHARRWECIWLTSKNARTVRAQLLKRRDAHTRRLEDELRTTSVSAKKASLSRLSIRKTCNVALAWDIGLLRDLNLSMAEHARLYHLVSGDDEVTRHSIRHQREQARRYIPSCGSRPVVTAVRGRPIR